MKKQKKVFSKLLKIGISLLFLYFVFKKVSFASIWNILQTTNIWYLFIAIVALFTSQILSSNRLLLFFHNQSFSLSAKSNLKLYFIGMFYNFFIPGGIGGDAYKIYLLNKKFKWSAKKLTKAVFVDRLIGLVAILIWIFILILTLSISKQYKLYFIIPLLIVAGVFISKISIKKFFPKFNIIFTKTLVYSLFIQAFQLVSVIFIIKALHLNQHYTEYLILFLISAILSVISFAGIGVREYVFLKAALVFNFNSEISISIGLLFTLISFLVALIGVYFELITLNLKLKP